MPPTTSGLRVSFEAEDVAIRRATDEDRSEVLQLLADSMGWGDDDRYRRFFAWKHDENPFGTSPAWVATLDDRIIGLRIWLRWEFEAGARRWTAVRAVDTATHPDARGRGVFTRLTMHGVEQLRDEGVDFVFNTPNEKSRPGYLKMGWEQLGTLPTAVRFSGPSSMLRTARSRQPADKWSLPTDVASSAAEVFTDDAAAKQWLGFRRPADGRRRTALDPEVLRWRYRLADLNYRAVAHDDVGCAVFRLRERGPSTEAVVCLVLARTEQHRRRLLRRVAEVSDADHVLELTPAPALSAGFIPLPGQGPILTWRELADREVPTVEDFDLGMGDVELF